MNSKCASCWWQEGGRCYNKQFATVENHNGVNQGTLINMDTLCSGQGYCNKREALSSVIPNDKLTIVSEENKR